MARTAALFTKRIIMKGDRCMKKVLSVLLCAALLLSVAPAALAYPNQGKTYDVTRPEGRDYFPSDISQLPVVEGLNDLFEFLDPSLGTNGRVETAEDWQARRAEIADLVQYYYLGYKQPTKAENVAVSKYLKVKPGNFWLGVAEEINETEEPFFGDDTLCGGMYITVTNPDTGVSADIYATGIYIPQYTENAELKAGETNIKAPYPVILGVGGGISAQQRNEVLKRGYAIVNLNTASAYTDTTWSAEGDNAKYRTGAYTTLYPFDPNVYEYNSGALMGWAWGISRIIDAMENGAYAGLVDPSRTVVTGVSRNGKAALIAAAFDERIDIAAPCDPGQTGTASYRYTDQGQLFNYQTPNGMTRNYARNEKPTNVLTDSEAHWVNSKAEDFRFNVTSLPFDAHSVEALVAPRPMITFSGEEFDWLGSPSTVLTMTAVKEVYDFLGAGDDVAVRMHDGAHALQNRDVAFVLAIMDREFRNGGEGKLVVEDVYPEFDPPTVGAGEYDAIAEFSLYPYEVDSSYIQWAAPCNDVLWVEDELITAGMETRITAHSDADTVTLTLPDGTALTQKVLGGVAVFGLTKEQAQAGRYAVTSHSDKNSKTVYFQGMSIANALRHGITSNNSGGATSPIYGFTSRIDQSALELYVDGAKVAVSSNESTTDGYALDYGFKVESFLPDYSVVTAKNLKLAALPGYTLEVSFDKALYQSMEPTGSSSDDARERPSWASDNTMLSAAGTWPVVPNTLADDKVRAQLPATKTAFDTAVSFSFDEKALTAGDKAFTIGFSEPVNKNEFGIAMNFATSWTLDWNADCTAVTVTIADKLAQGQACSLYLFRLRDAENNMIGQNGLAGPIGAAFTVQ